MLTANKHTLEREDFLQNKYAWIWVVLAFQAGFINSFGFLVCGRYVSHVTGFGTQIGISLAQSDVLGALIMLATPIIFMLGAFTSSLFTLTRIEKGLLPRYDIVTGIMPIILFWFAFVGDEKVTTQISNLALATNIHLPHLFSLSFFCGMQNGCFATMTKGQIRTTHLTGISTDLGSDLARMLGAKLPAHELKQLIKLNSMRAFTFISFAVGAIISTWISLKYENRALIIPALTATLVFIVTYKRIVIRPGKF